MVDYPGALLRYLLKKKLVSRDGYLREEYISLFWKAFSESYQAVSVFPIQIERHRPEVITEIPISFPPLSLYDNCQGVPRSLRIEPLVISMAKQAVPQVVSSFLWGTESRPGILATDTVRVWGNRADEAVPNEIHNSILATGEVEGLCIISGPQCRQELMAGYDCYRDAGGEGGWLRGHRFVTAFSGFETELKQVIFVGYPKNFKLMLSWPVRMQLRMDDYNLLIQVGLRSSNLVISRRGSQVLVVK